MARAHGVVIHPQDLGDLRVPVVEQRQLDDDREVLGQLGQGVTQALEVLVALEADVQSGLVRSERLGVVALCVEPGSILAAPPIVQTSRLATENR